MTAIHIVTQGCSSNQADSEFMAGLLSDAGFSLTDNPAKADAIIINTCTVKAPTESRFYHMLETYGQYRASIIVTGCIPQTTPEKVDGYSMVGTTQIQNIVEVVEETLNGTMISSLVPEKVDKLTLPKIRKNEIIEIVPIAEGCKGKCTYCIVKRARGELHSYKPETIQRHVRKAVRDGAREIWLTAQDTGCYGLDIDTDLTSLIKPLLTLNAPFRIRIGMMNPNHFMRMHEDIMGLFESKKLFRFLHLPVQSGNDEVLSRMGRQYTAQDFIDAVKIIRDMVPDMTISTDVICGFPGETDEQFRDTVRLIEKTRPDVLNISRYWDRPKTPSKDMHDKVPPETAKERVRYVTQVYDWGAYQNNKRWKGWEGYILIDEAGKDETSIGRNRSYKQVIVKGIYRPGTWLHVRVTDITTHDLRADVIGKKA